MEWTKPSMNDKYNSYEKMESEVRIDISKQSTIVRINNATSRTSTTITPYKQE
jgi:hypothetical protein